MNLWMNLWIIYMCVKCCTWILQYSYFWSQSQKQSYVNVAKTRYDQSNLRQMNNFYRKYPENWSAENKADWEKEIVCDIFVEHVEHLYRQSLLYRPEGNWHLCTAVVTPLETDLIKNEMFVVLITLFDFRYNSFILSPFFLFIL